MLIPHIIFTTYIHSDDSLYTYAFMDKNTRFGVISIVYTFMYMYMII